MWGFGYFYWSGIIVNGLFLLGILIGVGCSLGWMIKDSIEEKKFWEEREKKQFTADSNWRLGDDVRASTVSSKTEEKV